MPDTKLSALPSFGTTPDLIYGEEGGNSRKYHGGGQYNVKTFGALGDGTGAALSTRYGSLAAAQVDYPFATSVTQSIDWAAIQKAINAAQNNVGGTVLFPAGNYKITQKVVVYGGSQAALAFIGYGSDPFSTSGGSIISGNFADYLFYVTYPFSGGQANYQTPINTVEGLGFTNQYSSGADITSALSPNPASNDANGATGNGYGGVYIPWGMGYTLRNLTYFGDGIGVAAGGFNNFLTGVHCEGSFGSPPASTNLSCGILARAAYVGNAKIAHYGRGLVFFDGQAIAENLDIERCGIGMMGGYLPYTFWGEGSLNSTIAAGTHTASISGRALNFEASGISAITLWNGDHNHLSNVQTYESGQGGWNPVSGLDASGANFSTFTGFNIAGAHTNAAVVMTGSSSSNGNVFTNVDTTPSSGTQWALQTVWFPPNAAGGLPIQQDPHIFIGCKGQDGAVLISQLPPRPSASTSVPVWVTDSLVPQYDVSTGHSNVGKVISGMLLTSALTAPSGTVLNFSTVPTWVTAGMNVIDLNLGYPITPGTTVNGTPTGTTVTVTPAVNSGSGVPTNESIRFSADGGSNRVPVRFNQGLQAWTIA
jgi:hypothetical protein